MRYNFQYYDSPVSLKHMLAFAICITIPLHSFWLEGNKGEGREKKGKDFYKIFLFDSFFLEGIEGDGEKENSSSLNFDSSQILKILEGRGGEGD